MRRGFTLIELLIVVAIIAILAAIAVPNFLEAQTRSKVSRVKADMRSIATAVEAYAVDCNKPPTCRVSSTQTLSGPSVINAAFTASCISARYIRLTTPVAYMTSVPGDPFATNGLTYDNNHNLSEVYDAFDYFTALESYPGGTTSDANGTSWRGAGLTSGAMWRVASGGPDKINRYGGATIAAGVAANKGATDYDPTNGTISAGDIVRIGSSPGPLNPSNANLGPAIDRINNKINLAGI